MNYAQLVHELLNCAMQPAPCRCDICPRTKDPRCTDNLMRDAAIAIQNLSCEASCEVSRIPCEIPAADTQ